MTVIRQNLNQPADMAKVNQEGETSLGPSPETTLKKKINQEPIQSTESKRN